TLQVLGSFVATLVCEGTLDNVNFNSPGLMCLNLTTGAVAQTITAPGIYLVPLTNLDQFRVRISAYSSGSVKVYGKGSTQASGFNLVTSPAGATASPLNLSQVGGSTVALGQAASAQSIPVVIASNQSNLPLSGAQDVTAAISITAADTGSSTVACQGL